MNNNNPYYKLYKDYIKKKDYQNLPLNDFQKNEIIEFEKHLNKNTKSTFLIIIITFVLFIIFYIAWFTYIYLEKNS
jgi:hypothetical protein